MKEILEKVDEKTKCQILRRSLLKPYLAVILSFRLVRSPQATRRGENLSLFSEGFPTRFTCGNDNSGVLPITSLVKAFVFCFLLLTLYFTIFHVHDVSGSVIGEIEIKGLYSIGREELLYMLGINPGGKIDAETVRLGIKRAFLKGIFEDISVETVDGEKIKVIINIKERNFIENIYVEGNYDISRRTIKKMFLLKENQFLACDMLDRAVNDLRHRTEAMGYPHAVIEAAVENLKSPYRVNIHLKVYTGEPEKIKKIIISGAGDEIRKVMELSEGDVFNQDTIKKDIDRIKNYYKKNDYVKPVIGPSTFADGILHITVNPGKRLHISLEGNDAVSTKKLLKEMPFFEVEEFSEDIVEEAVHRMLSVYHSDGYPFAEIAPVVTSKDDLIDLHFFVFEGIRVKINKISFTGNSIPAKSLKEIMSLKEGEKYNPDLIDEDREALKAFYNALGYLSADIEEFQTKYEESSHKMDIMVGIHEGLKTVIGKINILGADHVPEKEIEKVLHFKPGDAYNDVDIADARYRIIELYSTKGFPDASVAVKKEIEDHNASITYQIHEGSLILFGKVIVAGNQDTKYIVVKRELLQHDGKPFDFSQIINERQKLYKLGLFTSIDIEALERYDDKKDTLIKLREGNAGSAELSLGYGEYERYRARLDLSYRNIMGMNRQALLRFELSSIEKRYILQFSEPWFLGFPLQFRAFLLGEDKKEINVDTRETRYKLIRHTVSAGVDKKISKHIKAELYYEFSVVNTFDVKPDVVLSKEDTGTLVISGVRFGLIYDTRDNPFNPTKGILTGLASKFTSPIFLSETHFIKISYYGNVYHEIGRGVVLATSLRGGIAQGYQKTDELPIVERFFLGGRTTVRGYDQDTLGPKGKDGNPIGGNAFLMENLELRIPLTKSIGIVTFLDGGNVWLKINEMNLGDIKFTTGLGLRYNTPVGPISVDYGVKLKRAKGESSGALHFSIGQTF